MIKNLAKRLTWRLGYDVMARGSRGRVVLIDTLQPLLARVQTVLDVGANKGQFRDYLRQEIGYGKCIISFEPNPDDYEVCRCRAEGDAMWEVYPWALGSSEGELSLNIMQDTVFSSFHAPRADVVALTGNEVVRKVRVPVRTLDNVIPALGIDLTATYLKCDTQGFDLEVFRGARQTLNDVVAIQTEVSLLPIYEDTPDFLSAISELTSLGFAIAALSPVAYDRGAVIEYDCVLLNKRLMS